MLRYYSIVALKPLQYMWSCYLCGRVQLLKLINSLVCVAVHHLISLRQVSIDHTFYVYMSILNSID